MEQLPRDGIADVVVALRLEAGATFVDLACGRGGYGLEVARRTGARLVGVDFAAVAIDRARTKHSQSWSDVHADFRVGTLTATGLPDASAAGVPCVDGMRAEGSRTLAAMDRMRRVLVTATAPRP